jgi:hypothetical protein
MTVFNASCGISYDEGATNGWHKWGTDEYVIKKRPKKKRWRENRGFQRGHPYHLNLL